MSSPDRIVYTPRSDASLEHEAAALAAAYRYILDCHAKKEAVEAGGGEASEATERGGDDTHGQTEVSD